MTSITVGVANMRNAVHKYWGNCIVKLCLIKSLIVV